MVFVIQNTQNRDSRAIHLKLDELIRANVDARNKMINLEEMTDEELAELHKDFCKLHEQFEEKAEIVSDQRKKRRAKKKR